MTVPSKPVTRPFTIYDHMYQYCAGFKITECLCTHPPPPPLPPHKDKQPQHNIGVYGYKW